MKKLWMAVVVLCISGCVAGPRPVDPGTSAYETAQKTVNELFTVYSGGFSRLILADKVDADFFTGKEHFLNSVAAAYSRSGVIEMNAFPDSVQAQPGILSVKVRWEKKYIVSGGVELDRGMARLTFRDRKGRWLLMKVSGDNPFN